MKNAEAGIMHYGQKCYPTQLFEVFALLVILITVYRTKSKFKAYLFLYAVSRFIIEYFRGDDRGDLFGALSPAQAISISIIIVILYRFAAGPTKKVV